MKKVKYKIGQNVFFLCDNTVCEEEISAIFNTTSGIYYWTGDLEAGEELKPWNGRPQDEIFADKKSLLESL